MQPPAALTRYRRALDDQLRSLVDRPEPRVIRQVFATNGSNGRPEHAGVVGRQHQVDVVVRATRGAREEPADAARPGAAQVVCARLGNSIGQRTCEAYSRQVQHRLLHRDLNHLAGARDVAMHQRGQNADGHVHARARVADVGTHR